MIRIDMDPGLEGKMDRIGKAINKALAFTLTDSATFANQYLLKALKAKVDRPAPFTLNRSGYGITIARIDDPKPFSEAIVKPAQAAYERFIFGMDSVRGLGAAGASENHVWVPGQRPGFSSTGSYSVRPRLSPYGGVPNSYSQALYDMTNQQFAMTLRTPGRTTGLAPSSQGGVFYGKIDGKTGFWARPKRTAPIGGGNLMRAQARSGQSYELHQRGANGRFIATGRSNWSPASRSAAKARKT